MTWVLIKDNIIENIIAITHEAAETYVPPDGMQLAYTDEWCNIGWLWNDGHPVDPNPQLEQG